MSTPSVLKLKIVPGCDEIYVQFLVNGEDLGDLIRRGATGKGARYFPDDALPYSGGDYRIEDTVLGVPARTRGMIDAVLFACGCGHTMCSGVLADVSVTDSTITLRNFRAIPDKESDLGPISFARAEYEGAIADLERQVARWTPPPPSPRKPPLITPPPST